MNPTVRGAAVAAPAGVPPVVETVARDGFWSRSEPMVLGVGLIVVFLAVWEAFPHVVTVSKGTQLFLTTPSAIAATLVKMVAGATFWHHLSVSATAFALGLAFSIVVAIPLGVALGRSQILDAILDPFVTAINATPRLVFLPLILLWFGIGVWSTVIIVFIGAVFPLLINTYEGVRNSDRVLINVVRSFGANEWQVNRLVVLPNSMPFIVAGLRLAIGRAVLGVVVAEFFGSDAGIGVLMVNAAGKYQVDVVFAGLVVFMALSLIMTSFVKALEVRLTRWRPETVKTF